MKHCVFASLFIAALVSLPVVAQAPAAKANSVAAKAAASCHAAKSTSSKINWTPPKTPWGDPDLQGRMAGHRAHSHAAARQPGRPEPSSPTPN